MFSPEVTSLATQYVRQARWRKWEAVLTELPDVDGQRVLDLGCGVGDIAAEFVVRGAEVIGLDADESLLQVARSRGLPRADFRCANLRHDLPIDGPVDGCWSSFVAAYFPELPEQLVRWREAIKPGGWLAITEIDDLFAHEPLDSKTKQALDAYVENALACGRYDFRAGRKLEGHVRSAGFEVIKVLTLPDTELSGQGPATPEVVQAWRERFARLGSLHRFLGPTSSDVVEAFLDCLSRSDHRSSTTVRCCIARAGGACA